ncbi:MAG: putative 2OG-Fe(II) oxygenase [Nannocystaceae bacterium]
MLRAAARHHDGWPLRQSLGQLYARMGDLHEAVEQFERALGHTAGDARSLNGLGAALGELGRFREAAAAFERATEHDPAQVEGLVNLGVLAATNGQPERALACLRAAIDRAPEHAGAQANLGRVLGRQGAYAEAIAALDRAHALSPDDPMLAIDAAMVRIAARAEDQAHAFLDRALRRHPGHSGLLAARALALGGQGHDARVRRLHGLHRFVHSRLLDLDPAALLPVLLDDPTLTMAPRSHATRGGLHSGAIDHRRRPAVAPLRDAIAQAVHEYRLALLASDHPFVRAAPGQLGLQMWSVVLREGGHQVPHIHPQAWLSGVFYAEVPTQCRDHDPDAGGLCFGEIDPEIRHRARFERRVIRPEPGLLVLFPSYLWHRTIDFSGPGRRVSVAFDVMGTHVFSTSHPRPRASPPGR